LVLFQSATSFAQSLQRYKIAVFTPLYLDSVFDAANNYRYNKTFPKFLNPGLEFYEGAQLALDSLQKVGAPLDVYFYDSRSQKKTVSQQVNGYELQNVNLIIGNAHSNDVRILADAAQQKKAPFISATFPNDAGIINNPYLVILNSTLRTHCEGIYRYLQKFHASDNIVLFRKPGVQEDQVLNYFKEFNTSLSGGILRIKYENIGNAFSASTLARSLDSTRRNVCIAGSLEEGFGTRLAQALASIGSTYPLTVMGMPTWDGISFRGDEYKDLEILYSTPFFYKRPDNKLMTQITNDFTSRFTGRPTDMFYRGYEVMLRFALLLLETKNDIASNLTLKGNTVFSQFDIQPVFLNKEAMTLDYFENKKLYFIKVLNGAKSIAY
jgi:ABC-type branched-subunit amino acid transport system substrate-binding protein